jgi:hypothetical protein
MDHPLRRLALSIRFKEYFLARDLSSRRIIIETAVAYAEKSNNEKKPRIIAWLNNLSVNNPDAFWDELHRDLAKSTLMYEIMHWLVGQV